MYDLTTLHILNLRKAAKERKRAKTGQFTPAKGGQVGEYTEFLRGQMKKRKRRKGSAAKKRRTPPRGKNGRFLKKR